MLLNTVRFKVFSTCLIPNTIKIPVYLEQSRFSQIELLMQEEVDICSMRTRGYIVVGQTDANFGESNKNLEN